jgi:hypothetical protein
MRSPHVEARLGWRASGISRSLGASDYAAARAGDIDQFEQIAASSSTRERFLTDLTLDPPDASGAESDRPQLDEDYLILPTIRSSRPDKANRDAARCSKSPKPISSPGFVRPQACRKSVAERVDANDRAFRASRWRRGSVARARCTELTVEGDRGFESCSLHRRVACEPEDNIAHSGCRVARPSPGHSITSRSQ